MKNDRYEISGEINNRNMIITDDGEIIPVSFGREWKEANRKRVTVRATIGKAMFSGIKSSTSRRVVLKLRAH